jgi:eukaryotic-like serine/threonine-protein kinase
MGEVYRATDTNLKRSVALKVLPASVAADTERLGRFQREAEVLAALNHPYIAAIYGLEKSHGTVALVMELIEGSTLANRIAQSAIPINETLLIARQIAEALEAAHEQNIIHRDLKPANIKVRPDGTVKVLDFGLAKAMEPVGAMSASASLSPTIVSPAMTQIGTILGTAAYMSPEQARGKTVDKRGDIWAFGCVLFEMLSGRSAFTGESTTDILAAVIHTEPDFGTLPAATPARVRALLERCLQKDLHERQRDIGDVRLELQQALKTGSSAALAHDRRATWPAPGRSRTWFVLGMSLAAVALAIIVGYRLRPEPTPGPFRFSILPPEGTSFLNVSQGGAPALSPDGRLVAFVASGANGQMLWVRSLDAFDARPLPGTEGARSPFWSPDGRSLGFFAQGKLTRVDLAGGQPQSLAVGTALAGTWNPDGKILFSTGAISVVPASGGTPTPVTEMNASLQDENHFLPVFLPDSRHYLLQVRGGTELEWQMWVGELGSNNRRLLVRRVTNALYAPSQAGGPGFLVYVRDRTLMAHRFDADRLALTADAVPVAQGVAISATTGSGDFSVSRNGVLAYRVENPPQEEMAWFDRNGKRVETLGDRPGNSRNNLRVSPDGKFAAFTRQGDASQDVWIYDLVRGVSSRLTFNGGRTPVWSPDGSQIAYLRGDTIYRKPTMAPGAEVSVWTSPDVLALNDWSGDGRYLLVTRWETKAGRAGRGLWLLSEPLGDSKRVEPILLESPALHGQFAPRVGPPRWVSFDSEDAGVRQVFVRTMPGDAPARWQVSTGSGGPFPGLGGNAARWRGDSREMYFVSGASFVAVTVEPGTAFRAGAPRVLFEAPPAIRTAMGQYAPGYDVDPTGQRFLSTLPSPQTPSSTITVIMNWQATLLK